MEKSISELKEAGIRPLTDPERGRLAECESIIKKGLNTFLEVGGALADIHDAMLYRETHKDFKRYCREMWDLGQSRAYQQMDGYRAVKLLADKSSTMVETSDGESSTMVELLMDGEVVLPTNERQVRPLTRLSPDDQVKAWSMVLKRLNEGKKLTASLVGKAAKEIKGETFERKRKETQQELEATALVSKIFKTQWQVMVDIITEEQDYGWKASSKKEVVKWLKNLVTMIEAED